MDFLMCSGNIINEEKQDFRKWYMGWDYDNQKIHANWEFYNLIKSPFIEKMIYGKDVHIRWNETKAPVYIKHFILMYPDYADALFLGKGVNTGGCTDMWLEDEEGHFDMSSIGGLKEWQMEYESKEDSWSEEEEKDFYDRGWKLAKEVRKLLPDNIELVYYYPLLYKYKISKYDTEYKLVPNERTYSLLPIGVRWPNYWTLESDNNI